MPATPVIIRVRNCGPIANFKNQKRALYSEAKKQTFLITDGDAQKRMKRIIACIASQLFSASATNTRAISTGALQLFSTACVPRDDRWTVIPELILKGELCQNPEDEGCDIIIEPIGEHEQQLLLDESRAAK